MNKKLLLITAGTLLLSGCSVAAQADTDNPTTQKLLDNSVVKEGYYMPDNGDGSYIYISNGIFDLCNFDFGTHYRNLNPYDTKYGTESDYEEIIENSIKLNSELYSQREFIVLENVGGSDSTMLVVEYDVENEEDIEASVWGSYQGFEIIDEDTLSSSLGTYTYYGEELPEETSEITDQ